MYHTNAVREHTIADFVETLSYKLDGRRFDTLCNILIYQLI
jgi:hypothetical protein